MATIAIIGGAGYIGLAYTAALAELGHDVVSVDVDRDRIRSLLSLGQVPIYEPGLEQLVQRGLASGRVRFTADYAAAVPQAAFAFICVGTPSTPDGRVDMRAIAAAARDIGQHAVGHTIVVNKSTMPVGSAQFVADILAEHARDGATFAVVSNPEFLREGSALHDIFHADRIVLGTHDRDAAAAVAALYAPLDAPVLSTDAASAEMIKYASNAFLATKISFINEVALICERLDADVTTVTRGMGMDDRINQHFLQAGVGFGGSCFPKDVRALAAMAEDVGLDAALLKAVLDINVAARSHVVEKLGTHLGTLERRTIGVLGLAFKPDTDDVREAPALGVIEQLLAAGARVRATDPKATELVRARFPRVNVVDDPYAAAMGADAIVLLTEWDHYRALDFNRLANVMRGRLVVDGRNALEPQAVIAAGLCYEGFGRRSPAKLVPPTVTTLVATGPVREKVLTVAAD